MRPAFSALPALPARGAGGGFGDVRLPRRALGVVAESEFDVLAEFLQLALEPMFGVLQFLDPTAGLPELLLELIDAQHQFRSLVGVAPAGNVCRRRLPVEGIELGLRRRRERDAGDQRRHEPRAKQGRHWRFPRWTLIRGPISRASVVFKSGRKRWRRRVNCFRTRRRAQLPRADFATSTKCRRRLRPAAPCHS